MIIFKSISLPIILVAVIEFAIFVNMAIPYYQGISLPFVASIVIGAIQLGATVDYAILMTTRYQRERQHGKNKMEAISIAHKTSMPSIISSGLSLSLIHIFRNVFYYWFPFFYLLWKQISRRSFLQHEKRPDI